MARAAANTRSKSTTKAPSKAASKALPKTKAATPKVAPTTSAPRPRLPASAPLSGAQQARADIAHLWRRGGFGASRAEVERLAAGGYEAAVDELLDLGALDTGAASVPSPVMTPAYSVQKTTDPAARAKIQAEREQLATWWLQRMVASTRPLQEKLPWFWHGHFATSLEKVDWPDLMERQLRTLRALGGGELEPLVQAVAKDPAMLVWLDATLNHAKSPNENFARELMELFTVGVGSYTETDVREGARAFTGWRLDGASLTWRLAGSDHDFGSKTVLGQTGAFGGEDVVRIAASHPSTARFVTARVWSRFARPAGPTDPVVTQLAGAFATHHSVKLLLRDVFLHPEFRAPATRTGLVKSPVEWVVGAMRVLGVVPDRLTLVTLSQLGQVPFLPPNVGGWPANDAWLGTNASLAKLNYARYLAEKADLSFLDGPGHDALPALLADMLGVPAWSARSLAALRAATAPEDLVATALVAPEHLLA